MASDPPTFAGRRARSRGYVAAESSRHEERAPASGSGSSRAYGDVYVRAATVRPRPRDIVGGVPRDSALRRSCSARQAERIASRRRRPRFSPHSEQNGPVAGVPHDGQTGTSSLLTLSDAPVPPSVKRWPPGPGGRSKRPRPPWPPLRLLTVNPRRHALSNGRGAVAP